MNKTFAVTLLAALTVAQGNSDHDIINYAAKFGKTYKSVQELGERAANLMANVAKRGQLKKDNPLATFGDTQFSDWSKAEFEAMLGLRTDSGRRELKGKPVKPGPSPSPSPDGYTNLANIDWKAAGKVHAVKNQGSCGSCAAFCTASVMESMVAIKYGTPVVRLSEQHALDCGAVYGNYSCNGGWMERYFEFFSAEGAMLYSDYPYLGVDQSCQQNSSSTIAAEGDWATFVWLPAGAPVADIHAELVKGPLSIGLNASDWSDYTGGIMQVGDSRCDPNSLNHGVMAVAFTQGTESDTGATTTVAGSCRSATQTEKKSKNCAGSDEVLSSGKCCTFSEVPVLTVSPASFTIQNQWGSSWGDNGMIHFEAMEGTGVCGMNQEVQGLQVK